MKTPINFLTLTFSLSFFILIFCSFTDCGGSVGPPDPPPGYFPPPEYSNEFPDRIPPYVDDDSFEDEDVSSVNLSLEEAMATIDPDVHSDMRVDIKGYNCTGRGQTLLVYNPNAQSLSFYDSPRFTTHWFKNGKPVRTNKTRLICVCKGEYAVIVIDKWSNRGVGIAFASVAACYFDEVATKATDN